MSSPEFVDVLGENGDVITTVTRDEAERDNSRTENVLVFVFNSLGKVWLHRRPDDKRHYPGLWDISACGGVISGETVEQAASREQGEEMGFTSDLVHVDTFLNIFPSEDGEMRSRLSHIFLGISDQEPQPNKDAAEFLSVPHDDVARIVSENKSAYVPPFLAEYERAHSAYLRINQEIQ